MKTTRHSQGFSLMELLMVVALIAVILALLLPSMGTFKEATRKIACASNERQMGEAITLYITEHDGVYPYHRRGMTNLWAKLIVPFMSDEYDAFRCPSRPIWRSSTIPGRTYPVQVKVPGSQNFIPYGYNGAWLGWDNYPPHNAPSRTGRNYTKVGEVLEPGRQIVLADSRLSRWDTWAQSLWYGARHDNEGVGDPHSGKANVLFADGHVESFYDYLINDHPDYRLWWIPNNAWDPGY